MRSEENTDVLYLYKELAVQISSAENLEEALDCILKSVRKNSGLDCGGIYVSDAEKGDLTLAASKGLPEEFIRVSSYYPPDSPNVKMARMGIPLYFSFKEHLKNVSRSEKVLENEGLRSIAILPIIYKGKLKAVLVLASHTNWETESPTRLILESVLINIADSIVRLTIQRELKEKEKNFRTLFENLEDLVFVVSKNKRLIHFNPAAEKVLGYTISGLLNINISDLVPKNSKLKIDSLLSGNNSNKNDVFETGLLSIKGQEIPFEMKITKGEWQGEEVYFCISRNISKRKIAEEEAKNTFLLYRETVNAIKDWIFLIDDKGVIILANDSLLKVHKNLKNPVEIIGRNITEIKAFSDTSIIKDITSPFKTKKEFLKEYNLGCNGKNYDFEIRSTPVYPNRKQKLLLVTIRNITEQRKSERELIESEKRFKDISLSLEDWVIELDKNNNISYISGKSVELLTKRKDSSLGKNPLDILSELKDESHLKLMSLLNKKEPIADLELKILKTDGTIGWFLVNGKPVFDGEVYKGFRGVLKDITGHKNSIEKLAWNENILNLITESSRIGIYFVNQANDKILFTNNRFYELWGIEDFEKRVEKGLISHKEIISVLSTKLKDPNHFRRSIETSNKSNSELKFETEYTLLNNRIIYNYSTEIVNHDGAFIGRVYTFKDITERKIYNSITENEKEYLTFIEQAPDAIIIADSEANILSANPATIKLFGYSKAELIKMNATNIMDPENLLLTPIKFKELNTGKTLLVERMFVNNRGVKINTEVRVRKISGNKLFAIIRDLSERNNSIKEQTVARKFKLLQRLYIKLKSFKHGESSAMILNRILLYTRNMTDVWTFTNFSNVKESDTSDIRDKNIQRLKSLAEEYVNITYPLLKRIFTKIEILNIEFPELNIPSLSGGTIKDFHKSYENLNKCFRKFLESIITKTEMPENCRKNLNIIRNVKNINKYINSVTKIFENNFITNLKEEIHFVVNIYTNLNLDIKINFEDLTTSSLAIMNKDEFKEILTILFSNSFDALSNSNNINKRIDLFLENSESGILFKFQNNGPALDEKMVKKLFKSETSTKGKSRGFGLNYTKKCLLKYGGNIEYNSAYENGAKFIIELAEI